MTILDAQQNSQTILSPRQNYSAEDTTAFRLQFDKVFQRGLHLQDKKTKEKALGHKRLASEPNLPNRVTLDDALVECFSTLSPQCRDEELEDLAYFMLDLYQFHGISVAISEIDITQVVVDLRTVLEEHAGRQSTAKSRQGAKGRKVAAQAKLEEHIFLVLDKNVQALPWENLPILRGRSVSRLPNVQFLLDRVELARMQRQKHTHDQSSSPIKGAVIDPRKGYYILNPSGDLYKTQERFEGFLGGMKKAGWQGITGEKPTELQFVDALKNNDLIMYGSHRYTRFYPHLIMFSFEGTLGMAVASSIFVRTRFGILPSAVLSCSGGVPPAP